MTRISLLQANAVVDAALAKGRELGIKPLAVVVLDAGGHLITCQRADGASAGRVQIATGKAAGALFLGLSSRSIAAMAADRPAFLSSLGSVAPAGVIPSAGGVIVVDAGGFAIGAIGISGDTPDNDEACALAGAAAAGLVAQN